MAGGPPWSQRGTNGGGQTVAINDRPAIKQVDKDQSGDVGQGNTEVVDIFAPSGSLYKVSSMFLKAPADADWTSGSHDFRVISTQGQKVMLGKSTYQDRLEWNFSNWIKATSSKTPSDNAATLMALHNVKATESESIRVKYNNNADAAQENTRNIRFEFEEVTY